MLLIQTLCLLVAMCCVCARKDAIPIAQNSHHIYLGTTSYYLFREPKQWEDAWEYCRQWGSYLLVIDTKGEEEVVKQIIANYPAPKPPRHDFFHVGLHDLFVEDDFVTVLGTPLANTSFKWAEGEPNLGKDENCVAINREILMYDLTCNNETQTYPFICEQRIS